jgi:hypothetical protein
MRVFVPSSLSPDVVAASGGRGHGSDPQVLFALAARHAVQVRHLRPSVPTLEDVFAKAVGEE